MAGVLIRSSAVATAPFPLDQTRLDTLIEINSLINSNYTNLNGLLTRIVESAMRLTSGQASSLLLLDSESNRLFFEVALGTKGPQVKRFSLNLGEGIAGWVAEHARSLVVNDVQADERFHADISKQIGFPTQSILAVPMLLRDECVGVIEIINRSDGGIFGDDDLQWLEVFATQAAIAVQNARSYEAAQLEIGSLRRAVSDRQRQSGCHEIVGRSEAIKQKLEVTRRAATTDSSVLLLGESGVGKELFAEQIHLHSERSAQPFIRVNCAAIPEGLLESELFGHVKGAFTDASADRRGKFELADGGTILLDEVGEIPLTVQPKLLRVLQERVVEPVGGSERRQVDVRIVAATNRDIEREVREGRFRSDLYYRLNVLPIFIPPLRERRDDIEVLAEHALQRFRDETKKQITGFTPAALTALRKHSWPGNVRELENAVERAVVICQGETVDESDLVLGTGQRGGDEAHSAAYEGRPLREAMRLFKKRFITRALEAHGWRQTQTAQTLGIQRTYLSRLVKELEIRT